MVTIRGGRLRLPSGRKRNPGGRRQPSDGQRQPSNGKRQPSDGETRFTPDGETRPTSDGREQPASEGREKQPAPGGRRSRPDASGRPRFAASGRPHPAASAGPRHPCTALAAFGALAAADLYATAKAPRGPARAAKPFLMPALAAYAQRAAAHRAASGAPDMPDDMPEVSDASGTPAPRALLAGLACATVGDTALLWDRDERALLVGMAAFLGTQLSYTAGMTARLGAVRGLRARPKRAVAVLAGWAAVNAVLAPGLERRLRLPVAGYSLALAAMGAAALGVGGKVAVGGAAFVASDALIGLQAAGREFPGQEVLIMAGYLLGQYLITAGWLEHIPS